MGTCWHGTWSGLAPRRFTANRDHHRFDNDDGLPHVRREHPPPREMWCAKDRAVFGMSGTSESTLDRQECSAFTTLVEPGAGVNPNLHHLARLALDLYRPDSADVSRNRMARVVHGPMSKRRCSGVRCPIQDLGAFRCDRVRPSRRTSTCSISMLTAHAAWHCPAANICSVRCGGTHAGTVPRLGR